MYKTCRQISLSSALAWTTLDFFVNLGDLRRCFTVQIVECQALPTLVFMLRSEDVGIHYEAVSTCFMRYTLALVKAVKRLFHAALCCKVWKHSK